ncbi:MAG: HEAT repeat domain-containing protein [Methanomassiliicoccaceae archaeon]|nr:HEAT repeat domain-containing protein [Methanomassiliicoccaceae archaeon]
MSVSRLEYLERFLDGTDFVISGRKNAISGDRWLVNNYDPAFYDAVAKHLKNTDERVRADVIRLLGAVGERRALDTVRELRTTDKESVKLACLGYLDSINESDTMIPELFNILEHMNGPEFKVAAMKMTAAGRSNDVPRLRRIYGQVTGEMRMRIRDTLTSIIERDEELKKKKDLLLSVPVFPDEKKFGSFLDKSITYLDIRYRDGVAGKRTVAANVYTNVRDALRNMRIRMFNEHDNLRYYGTPVREMYDELLSLMDWASGDLSSKTVESEHFTERNLCPKCGAEMRMRDGIWTCVDCGITR